MIFLLSRTFTAPGRLLRAVSRLSGVRIISLLTCVAAVLLCADIEPVAAKNPQSKPPENIPPSQPVVLPPSGLPGSPPLILPPASNVPQPPKPQAPDNDAEEDAAQEPAVQRSAVLPPAQTSAAIAEGTQESKDKRDAIIIEKNIFSPDRKKWVSEPAASKQSAEKLAKKEINELILLGTVINRENRYAVLRTKKDAGKEGFKPSMRGDYIQGYLVKEIEEKKVILQDDADNTEYVLYINDDKKERVAEKTELKPQPAKASADDTKADQPAKKRRGRRAAKQPPIPADAPEVVKKAMEKNLEQEEKMKNAPPPADLPDTIKKAIEQAEGQDE